MIIAVHIILLATIFIWLWKKFPQPLFSVALFLKICAGIGLGLLYQYYYSTGDTWTFFSDAKNAATMLRTYPSEIWNFFWFDDWSRVGTSLGSSGLQPLFIVKWVTIFNLLTGDNYWLASIYLSLLSFAGAWSLFRAIAIGYPTIKTEAALAVLFIPSVVFWSSGVIKECLALGALFYISAFFLRWYAFKELFWLNVFLALISLWVLWNLKYYWLAVWLAAVLPLVIIRILSPSIHWIHCHPKRSWMILFLASVIAVSTLHPNFYYHRILSVVVDNYNAYIRLSERGDVILYSALEPTLLSMAKNAWWAIISGFFRPFVWEAGTMFQAISGVENMTLLILSAMTLLQFKKWLSNFNELHLALVFYLIMLSALLALSTPNFGSLGRYRIGFTPFLWLLVLATSGVVQYLPKSIQNLLAKD